MLVLKDKLNIKDELVERKHHRFGDTEIEFRIPGTNEVIWRGKNKLVLGGAGFLANLMFNLSSDWKEVTPSYNAEIGGLDNTVTAKPDTAVDKAYLFCVGTCGCGHENSQVFDVNYAEWIPPFTSYDAANRDKGYLVPFRYPLLKDDLSATLRQSYFGRKDCGDRIAYYFKAFENSNPAFIQQYIDGTPITSTVYNNKTDKEVESFVELRLSITKDDCREWFVATTGINECKINTLSICYAWKYKGDDGFDYYQDIRPVTRLNFPNEALIDLSKGLDIIYHIYF